MARVARKAWGERSERGFAGAGDARVLGAARARAARRFEERVDDGVAQVVVPAGGLDPFVPGSEKLGPHVGELPEEVVVFGEPNAAVDESVAHEAVPRGLVPRRPGTVNQRDPERARDRREREPRRLVREHGPPPVITANCLDAREAILGGERAAFRWLEGDGNVDHE